MKIIFLDIDGVLNSEEWAHQSGGGYGRPATEPWHCCHEQLLWCPAMIGHLRRIVETTGAKIVLSSSWRHYSDLWPECFAVYGWPDIPLIGKTPDLSRGTFVRERAMRGNEVKVWLDEHPEVTASVCLDDDTDFFIGQCLIRTDPEVGLTAADADRAIALLMEVRDEQPQVSV